LHVILIFLVLDTNIKHFSIQKLQKWCSSTKL